MRYLRITRHVNITFANGFVCRVIAFVRRMRQIELARITFEVEIGANLERNVIEDCIFGIGNITVELFAVSALHEHKRILQAEPDLDRGWAANTEYRFDELANEADAVRSKGHEHRADNVRAPNLNEHMKSTKQNNMQNQPLEMFAG